MSLNRREWLRSGLLAGVGLAAAPAAYCEPWLDKPELAGVQPPTAPKAALKARLSANENPHGPSPKALKAINEAASEGFLYPFQYKSYFLPVRGLCCTQRLCSMPTAIRAAAFCRPIQRTSNSFARL
jgi:hypothetical protein